MTPRWRDPIRLHRAAAHHRPTIRELAISLPCTHCNSGPDEPCRGTLEPSEQVLGHHRERRDHAARMRRDGLA